MFVSGTMMAWGLLVAPSFQWLNSQPLVAVAVSTALLPTTYTPPPVTLPALAGTATTVTVTVGGGGFETVRVAVALAMLL